MRKGLAILPTIGLFGCLLWGVYLIDQQPASGHSWIGLSMAGLFGYAFLALFVSGMTRAVQGIKRVTWADRLFYGYLVGMMVVVLVVMRILGLHH